MRITWRTSTASAAASPRKRSEPSRTGSARARALSGSRPTSRPCPIRRRKLNSGSRYLLSLPPAPPAALERSSPARDNRVMKGIALDLEDMAQFLEELGHHHHAAVEVAQAELLVGRVGVVVGEAQPDQDG